MGEKASQIGPYVEQLIENDYAQEKLREAVANLGATAGSLSEAAAAIKTGRRKPRGRWRKRLFAVVALGATGAAIALAMDEDLRRKVLGGTGDGMGSVT
jgi:ferric-dicitrate binding protein FerR (iron transport regulator)